MFLETNAIFRKSYFEDVITYKAEQIFPVFRYHDRWKNLQLKDFSATVEYTANEENKGYYFTKKSKPATDKAIKKYMKYSDVSAPILSTNKKYLNEIAKFCKKHGTKLVLISTPSTKTGTTSDITLWKQFQRISVLIISIPIFSVTISRLIGKGYKG